jgi:hypothetical protein
MADFTFLFNRKGAIYPLDLTSDINLPTSISDSNQINNSEHQNTEPSQQQQRLLTKRDKLKNEWPYNSILECTLTHLCCKVIVADKDLIEKSTDFLPAELFISLFKASLYPVKDYAIDVNNEKCHFLKNEFISLTFFLLN